jgi:tetratricopeptide (TPR) repeat protein
MGVDMISRKERITIRKNADAFLMQKDYQAAIDEFLKGLKIDPSYLWYELFIGDIYYFFLHDSNTALQWYQSCYTKGKGLFDTTPYTPLRYLLKRLSKIVFSQENYLLAATFYEEFIAFRPSNFHENDFLRYAHSLEKIGKREEALEVLELGKKFSKSRAIREKLNQMTNSSQPPPSFPVYKNGYKRIPIKTDIIVPGDSIPSIVESLTKNIRQKGDILTIASCVVAVAENRKKTIDVVTASWLARLLSRFVHDDNFDFGGNAPLCNPLSMQMAMDESGWWRILFAALFGGFISKLWKGSGMFYRLAGEQAALIDDMPGAIAPFDYSIILGPLDSNQTAHEIKNRTGCDAAILDANDLDIAWAVGCSNESLRSTIEQAMCDNPAGNGDQQTPIILLRPS